MSRRQKIEVQQKVEVRDAYGHVTETWSTYCTRRCMVKTKSAREIFKDQQATTEIIHIVDNLRYDRETKAITADMRVVIDSVNYELIAPPVNKDFRNREIQLTLRLSQ